MGLRLHKVMGYGLTDVASKDYRITDPRINADSFLLDRGEDASAPQPYDEWLAERYPAFDPESAKPNLDNLDAVLEQQLLEKSGAEDALKVVTWEGEYGLPNVLVVRPAGETNWHRYNDPIDYQEGRRSGGSSRTTGWSARSATSIPMKASTWMRGPASRSSESRPIWCVPGAGS
ncbi:hypothetical protein ACFW2V_12465 [Streptomyces sp. NPDC058947]|uniref:hypothetical protein n=1 Tax=Streptomyces sp. NPDC058947 TaxID=3346675 RepID=UPI003679F2B5